MGNSTGGGMVETVSVDGFPLRTRGDSYVLLMVAAGAAANLGAARVARPT